MRDSVRDLSGRFAQREQGEDADGTEDKPKSPASTPKTDTEVLKPYTLYFESRTRKRLDRAFKDAQHALYPLDFKRNEFYTTLLEVGISHLEEVEQRLRELLPPPEPE